MLESTSLSILAAKHVALLPLLHGRCQVSVLFGQSFQASQCMCAIWYACCLSTCSSARAATPQKSPPPGRDPQPRRFCARPMRLRSSNALRGHTVSDRAAVCGSKSLWVPRLPQRDHPTASTVKRFLPILTGSRGVCHRHAAPPHYFIPRMFAAKAQLALPGCPACIAPRAPKALRRSAATSACSQSGTGSTARCMVKQSSKRCATMP